MNLNYLLLEKDLKMYFSSNKHSNKLQYTAILFEFYWNSLDSFNFTKTHWIM